VLELFFALSQLLQEKRGSLPCRAGIPRLLKFQQPKINSAAPKLKTAKFHHGAL